MTRPTPAAAIEAVHVPETIEPAMAQALLSAVSAEKRQKIARFVRREDQYRSLLGDALVRSTIVRHTPLANADIRFVANDYGKPSLAGKTDFSFNLSHSGSWVAMIWSKSPLMLGVDVERVAPIDFRIAESFFSPRENVDLAARTGEAKLDYFYRLWTLKESYIKAIGKGLSMPLGRFSLVRSEPGVWHSPEAERFRFASFELDRSHIVSACAEDAEAPAEAGIVSLADLCESLG